MTRKSLTEFNTSPYYDDFNDDKNFLKVLFKPGVAVQARELNQLQSILSDQIAKFGDHIFKDGSPVLKGTFNIDVNVKYIKLHQFELEGVGNYATVSNYISQLEGRILLSSSGSKFLVRKSEAKNTTEPDTIIGTYISGGVEVGEGEVLTTEAVPGLLDYQVTTAYPTGTVSTDNYVAPVTGQSSIASVDEGVFYISGFFTKSLSQTIALSKYSNTPSFRVGLEVDETISTSGDDISLYDNAQGSPNFSAPGGDRFKTTLTLTKKELSDSDGNLIDNNSSYEFYEFVRVRNGDKVDQIKNSQYAYLGEELARRTYETNGDFVVRNFILDVDEYSSAEVAAGNALTPPIDFTEKLKLTLDPGKAYVKGHEIETIAPTEISLDKCREFTESFSENVNSFLGNYVCVELSPENFGDFIAQQSLFTDNIKLDIYNAASSPAIIGSCRFRQLTYNSVQQKYRLSFFDLNLNSGESVSDIVSFTKSGSTDTLFEVVSPSRVANVTTISNPERSILLFSVSNSSLKTVSNVDYTFNKLFDPSTVSFTNDSQGGFSEIEIGKTSSEEFAYSSSTYIDDGSAVNYILIYNTSTGDVYDYATNGLDFRNDNNVGYIRLDGDLTSQASNLKAVVRMELDTSSNKSKTKNENETLTFTGDQLPFNTAVSLKKYDIIKINSITKQSDNSDLTEYFELDNGQRDSFYDVGSIKLIDNTLGLTASDNIVVDFDHFTHSGDGYFDVDSYKYGTQSQIDDPNNDAQILYEDIPIYTSELTGKSYSLTDTVDFRPTILLDAQGQPTNTTIGSRMPYGAGDDKLEVTYSYFLSRIDKIALTKDKQFIVIKGAASLSPKTPPDDPESMSMYIVTVPPYTYNDNDVKVVPIHNRRYTMRDIGILDRRIEELQARSNLRLLQEKTKNIQIRDNSGTEIFKNGILIDDFSGHGVGDVSSSDYKCSIDFDTQELRPSFKSDSYDLVFDSNSSTGIVKKGPLLLSDYSSKQHQVQSLANKTMNVNPHKMSYWFGEIKMNPSSDMWFNQTIDPRVNINDIGENNAWQNLKTPVETGYGKGFGTQWNDWESIWTGKESFISSEEVNPDSILQSNLGRLQDNSTKNYLSDVVDAIGIVGTGLQNRIEKNVNNRKVDNSVVPFIESGEVIFVATNLKPNDDFWAFFDELDVTSNVTFCNKITIKESNDISKVYIDGIYDGETITGPSGSAKVIKNLNDGTGSMYVKILSGSFSENDVISGSVSTNVSSTIQASTLVTKSDDIGTLCGTFIIPSTSSSKFRTGQRLFRLINNDENTLSPTGVQSTPLSLAENSYTSQGIMEDPENFISSTRMPLIKRSNICDILSVSRDPLSRELNSLRRCLDWRDPLSQTFIVDLASNRNGIFLDSVDLYFKSKDSNLPVSIEIRPTSNGFPSTSVVLPFSEVILNPSQVSTSAGPDPENNYTRFSFDAPVYLKPGEYAIVVRTNGIDYDLWSGEVGVPILNTDGTSDNTNQKVTKLPLVGSLYSSHNSGVWEKVNNESIMFRINKCEFNSGSKTLNLEASSPSESKNFSLFKFNVSMLKNFYNLDNPKFSYKFISEANPSFVQFHENRNVEFITGEKSFSPTQDFEIKSEFSIPTSNLDVSPVLDMERMSVITVQNKINNSLLLEPTSSKPKTEVCYISKQVNLKTPYQSKDIRVYLDMYKTVETGISVYYKVGNINDQTPFSQKDWYLMTQITPDYIFSEYNNDYREFVFGNAAGVNLDGASNFDTYAIKIVMSSTNNSKVPKVRNLRAVALQEPAGV